MDVLSHLLSQLNGPDDAACEASAIALGELEAALLHLMAMVPGSNADTRFWVVRALWST